MKIQLRNFRLGFADLFKPKSIAGSDPKFSATFIAGSDSQLWVGTKEDRRVLPASDFQTLVDEVVKEKWGKPQAKIKNWAWNKADGSTTRDRYVNGDGEFWAGFDEDTWFVSANKGADRVEGEQIQVVDQGLHPITQQSGQIFSGCYVNGVIDIYAMDRKDGNLVTASLEAVQLLRRGEPLGFSAVKAEEEFEEEAVPAGEDAAADMM